MGRILRVAFHTHKLEMRSDREELKHVDGWNGTPREDDAESHDPAYRR